MATRSERARYETERAGPKKPKQPRPPRRNNPVDTSLPGVSATDRKVGFGSTAARNVKKGGTTKAAYKLEDANGRPSRKSTRKSANRAKPESNLARRQIRRTRSAKARATKARSTGKK